MSLRLQNARKNFKGPGGVVVAAVDDVCLDLKPGDFCAIHGPSGSGKTTLLLVAGALLSPDSGSVSICGLAPYAMRPAARSRLRADHVGFVFQQFHLFPYLTVLENVLSPTLAKRSGKDVKAEAVELLRSLCLDHRMRHTPHALSVGEQRRAALARALLFAPSVLIADEPTGNLDPANAAVIISRLTAFAANGGVVLVATHDDAAAQAATLRLEMRQGKLG